MSVHLVTELEELASMAEPWAALLGPEDAAPTADPRWYTAAARTLHAHDSLQVSVVTEGSEVVAVLPLIVRRSGHLEVMGSRALHEPVALAHRDPASLARALDALLRFGRPVHLGRLASDGEAVRQLGALPRHQGIAVCRPAAGAPFVPLDGDWAGFEASLSASRRSSLRRNLRRADEAGGFEFEVRSPALADVDHELDDFISTEHRSWKGEAGTSLAADQAVRGFYQAYARASADAGDLRVARLTVGGRLAAVQLAVERAGALWILKLGYDEEYSSCAPGIVLTHETLRWAFGRGLERYELLGDEAPWTRIWTDRAHAFTVVRAYPPSARGIVAAAADAAHQARKLVRRPAQRASS